MSISDFDLISNDGPSINDIDIVLSACDVSGGANYDLSNVATQLLDGLNSVGITVTYHASLAEADSGSNAIDPLYTTSETEEELFVRLENIGGCYTTTNFELNRTASVVIPPLDDINLCRDATTGTAQFDLAIQNDVILNGLNSNDYAVSYHSSLAEAENYENILPRFNDFSANTTIYVRLQSLYTPSCFDISQFNIVVNDNFSLNTVITPLTACAPSGSTTMVDLTQIETELLAGLDPSNLLVTYHASQAEAEGSTNPLDTDYEATLSTEELFVRVSDVLGSCSAITSFEVHVSNSVTIPSLAGLTNCDEGSGSATFDLTERDADVLVGLSPTDYVVTYHETQADADAGFPILPANYTSGPGQVYVRLQSLAHPDCFDTSNFALTVSTVTNTTPFLTVDVCSADFPISISAIDDFDSYLWSTGATTQDLEISTGGVYTVTATKFGCDVVSEITINEVTADPEAIAINLCPGESETLMGDPVATSYLWSTGETTAQITVSNAGIYTLQNK